MSKEPKDVHVKVTLLPGQKPPFKISSTDLPMGRDSELIFRNHGHPGFRVHFELQEPTHGYLFPPNKTRAEAVWSQMGADACPETQIWDVFRALEVSPDRKTLTVRNGNVHKEELGKFTYTLRVVRDDPLDWMELDPGGDNQNGGTDRSDVFACSASGAVAAFGASALLTNMDSTSTVLAALGGGAVGLIVGLIADRF